MVVVEEFQRLNPQRLIESLAATVDIVAIGGHTTMVGSCHDELEDEREKTHLRAQRLRRIVEGGIGIVGEVYLSVDIAAPHHILIHRLLGRKRNLRPQRHVVAVRLLLLLLLLPSGLRLSVDT